MSLNGAHHCSPLLRQNGSAPKLPVLALIYIGLVEHLNGMKSRAVYEIRLGQFLLNPAIGGGDEPCQAEMSGSDSIQRLRREIERLYRSRMHCKGNHSGPKGC